MESQQRKQGADLRKLEALLRAQARELAEERERSRCLVENAELDRLMLVATGIDNDELLVENKRQRRELLELRQLVKTCTVAVPQMQYGTATLYPN